MLRHVTPLEDGELDSEDDAPRRQHCRSRSTKEHKSSDDDSGNAAQAADSKKSKLDSRLATFDFRLLARPSKLLSTASHCTRVTLSRKDKLKTSAAKSQLFTKFERGERKAVAAAPQLRSTCQISCLSNSARRINNQLPPTSLDDIAQQGRNGDIDVSDVSGCADRCKYEEIDRSSVKKKDKLMSPIGFGKQILIYVIRKKLFCE